MVYKKYIKKNGRLYGPYYYESYREDGKVKTRFISGPSDFGNENRELKNLNNQNLNNFSSVKNKFIISLILLFFITGFLFFMVFTGFSKNLTGYVVSGLGEEVIESFDKQVDLEIKETGNLGNVLSKNKNKRMDFYLQEGNLRLYFELLNYSEFIEETGEVLIKEGIASKEEIIEKNREELEEIADKSEEIPTTENEISIKNININKIKDELNNLNKEKIEEISEQTVIELEKEEFDINIDEEKSKEIGVDYKWGYKVKLKDLNFLSKIELTSNKEISVLSNSEMKIGNNLLSFKDLVNEGYTVRIETPALEIEKPALELEKETEERRVTENITQKSEEINESIVSNESNKAKEIINETIGEEFIINKTEIVNETIESINKKVSENVSEEFIVEPVIETSENITESKASEPSSSEKPDFQIGITGNFIKGITGRVVDNLESDLEYNNKISIYIERDFSGTNYIGEIVYLDPTIVATTNVSAGGGIESWRGGGCENPLPNDPHPACIDNNQSSNVSIEKSDDNRLVTESINSTANSAQEFIYKINVSENTITSVTWSLEGFVASSPSNVSIFIFNDSSGAWEIFGSIKVAPNDEIITLTLTNSAGIKNIFNSSNYSHIAAQQVTDGIGLSVSTDFVNLTINYDNTPPDINITNPAVNNSNTTDTGLDVNFTVSDSGVGLAECFYSNDTYSVNRSTGCGVNLTNITWSEGLHNVTIYVNDSGNNLNFSTRSFRIDTTAPSLTINEPNGTGNSLTPNINITVNDSGVGLGTCWYNITKTSDTSSVTVSTRRINNCANDTVPSNNLDNSVNYTIFVLSNDTLGNTNLTNKTFVTAAADSGGGLGGGGGVRVKEEIKLTIKENITIVPFCGNGILETGEECDDNNTKSGDGCSYLCSKEELGRIFVSSQKYSGNLNGIHGADKKCTELANSAGLEGKWIAVLSDSKTNARDRVIDPPWPLYNMGDKLVAISSGDLWDGSIENPVKYNEYRVEVNDEVWTGTFPDGYKDISAVCRDWFYQDESNEGFLSVKGGLLSVLGYESSNSGYGVNIIEELASGRFGLSAKKDEEWVSKEVTKCSNKAHLYCVSSKYAIIKEGKITKCSEWSKCKVEYDAASISRIIDVNKVPLLTGVQTRECTYYTGEIVSGRKSCETKIPINIEEEEEKIKIFNLKDELILIIDLLKIDEITLLDINLFLKEEKLFCGNGVLEPPEQCDDGNTVSGDGCSPVCDFEIKVCDEPFSVCIEKPECNRLVGELGWKIGNQCDLNKYCCNPIEKITAVCPPYFSCLDSKKPQFCPYGHKLLCLPDYTKLTSDTEPEKIPIQENIGICAEGRSCCMCVPIIPACGNNIIDFGEECDDGNLVGGDGCSALCQPEKVFCKKPIICPPPIVGCNYINPKYDKNNCIISCGKISCPRCGNGIVEPSEECDDGNTKSGDRCSALCQPEPIKCRKPIICLPPVAGCNYINTKYDSNGCLTDCGKISCPKCGNGILELGELCDDGNNVNGDGCSDICRFEIKKPVCGNGVLEYPEQCDDGNTVNGDRCNSQCIIEKIQCKVPSCLAPPPGCNYINFKYDKNKCLIGCGTLVCPICGNGILDPGELCDDKNLISGDGCSNRCKIEEKGNIFVSSEKYSGNLGGIFRADEKCTELANRAGLQGKWIAVLSDSKINARDRINADTINWPVYNMRRELVAVSEEDLWDGSIENPIRYNEYGEGVNDKVWTGTFPDGYKDISAVCRDWLSSSNKEQGRVGISIEKNENWVSSEVLQCDKIYRIYCINITKYKIDKIAICGNRILESPEQCDDGNLVSGDGCSKECKIEIKKPICGNKILEPPEECDDGNTKSGDGCSDKCKIEKIRCKKDSDCNDGLFCTLDKCVNNKCVYKNLNVDDKISCTIDSCDEENDKIAHTPDNSQCQDGLYCNGEEICDIKKGCVKGTPVNCDDNSQCSIDSCDEGLDKKDNIGQCEYDTSQCKCKKNSDCDDNNPCTDDICNRRICTNVNDNTNSCDDNLFCTIDDRCSEGSCIGDSRKTDDGISCTIDSCDEKLGIIHNTDDSLCNDELACTYDKCDAEKGCISTTDDSLCKDNIKCTVDSCNINKGCKNEPDNKLCKSYEVCDTKQGCIQTDCANCRDCEGFFDSCSYDECKIECSIEGACYYKGDVLGENCIPLDEACQSIKKCSDYSVEECENNACNVAPIGGKGCKIDNNKCIEAPYCGNSIIKPPEECDDGNTFNGDGCSAECLIEDEIFVYEEDKKVVELEEIRVGVGEARGGEALKELITKIVKIPEKVVGKKYITPAPIITLEKEPREEKISLIDILLWIFILALIAIVYYTYRKIRKAIAIKKIKKESINTEKWYLKTKSKGMKWEEK